MVAQNNMTSKKSTTEDSLAVAYLRVSTDKQSEKGSSIESQREYAKLYAEQHGLTLRDEHIFEESKPASKSENEKFDINIEYNKRPVFKKIMELIKIKDIEYFIVYSRDRLTRNVYEHFAIKQLLKQNGITLCYSKPGEYTSNEQDLSDKDDNSKTERNIENLIEIVLASIAELESSIISSRVQLGNKWCAESNLWPGGNIPFGYRTEKKKMVGRKRDNSLLKPIPYEEEIIKEIFELYANFGYSYRKLASIMNEKYPFKTWTKGSIESILRNEIYKGHIVWGRRGGRRNPGPRDNPTKSGFIKDMCIIDEELWSRVNTLKKQKSNINNFKYFSTPFLLQGKLSCSCGEEIKTKNYGAGKKSVYRCPTKLDDKNESHLIISKDLLEKKVISKLLSIITVESIHELWSIYEEQKQDKIRAIKSSIKDYHDKIDLLSEKLLQVENALDLSLDISIKLELKQLVIILEKEIKHYENIIKDKECLLKSFYQDPENFTQAFTDLFKELNNIDVYNKRMIIHSLVDSILLTKEDNTPSNELSIDIVLNPSSELFMPTS